MMTREQALALLTDRLCGELGTKEVAALQAYIENYPECLKEMQELEGKYSVNPVTRTVR